MKTELILEHHDGAQRRLHQVLLDVFPGITVNTAAGLSSANEKLKHCSWPSPSEKHQLTKRIYSLFSRPPLAAFVIASYSRSLDRGKGHSPATHGWAGDPDCAIIWQKTGCRKYDQHLPTL